jgi:hypothetical protein
MLHIEAENVIGTLLEHQIRLVPLYPSVFPQSRDVVSLCYPVCRGFWVLGRAIEIANRVTNNW